MDLSPAEWLIALWLLALGGFIGSFLNVVVYRMPAGMSVVAPRSRCPQCLHPIRWFDNVPVLSWFVLGGRCRDCRAAISRALSAGRGHDRALFLLLAVGEPLAEGKNLPSTGTGQLGVELLWGIYACHLLLLCTLLAAALMQYDGHRPPRRLFVPALVVGLAAPAVWPLLHPVPAWHAASGPLGGILDGLAGLATGAAGGQSSAAWPASAAAIPDSGWPPPAPGCSSAGKRPACWSWPPWPRPDCWRVAPALRQPAPPSGHRLADPCRAGMDPRLGIRLGIACAMGCAWCKVGEHCSAKPQA